MEYAFTILCILTLSAAMLFIVMNKDFFSYGAKYSLVITANYTLGFNNGYLLSLTRSPALVTTSNPNGGVACYNSSSASIGATDRVILTGVIKIIPVFKMSTLFKLGRLFHEYSIATHGDGDVIYFKSLEDIKLFIHNMR